MADPIISALVSDVVGRLTSEAIQEYGLLRGVKNDLSALENTFKLIQGVLYDAEMKQTTQKAVEEWLKTLKSASLEVQNVLDEAKTEAMIQRLHGEMGKKYKIRAFFSSRYNPLMARFRIAHKVKNIRKKLEDVDANRSKFHLTSNTTSEDGAGIAGEISNSESSSLMSKIYRRDEEKKMIVDKICNQDIGITHDDDDVQVYAIWGMGGIGKTTLAQYVYNHETVDKFFGLKVWVYVSAVFHVKQISKQIIRAICGPEDLKFDDMSLDDLQIQLQSKLKGKKFFVVMDDVWIENKDMNKWGELCKALSCGAKGSTVTVTTRKESTAQLMAKIPELQHKVGVLSEEESWSLFKMLSFPGRGERENVRGLELVGREIVEKCKGLPLAVKTLGSLMSTKKRVNEWQCVNDRFMLEMQENGILSALSLSYDDLLPHLKRCFAYCCVFSKGEEMSKDLLIELWMANEFIPSQGDVSLYVLGEEIFSCLVRRSFFQDVIEDDIYTDEKCKMHDLMHDLAQYAMRHDCVVIEPGKELITSDEVLHLSLSCHGFRFSKQDIKKLRPIRSMLVFDNDYDSSIRQIFSHVYLRVLHLNGIESSTFPESICKLIHLRYLKIEDSDIQALPDTFIYLQNLQTLILEECWQLRELPKGLRYMRNLQRVDTRDCPKLQHMPVGIKELTNLRRLSEFVVGENDGACIGELGNLNLLGWKLRLSQLENVGRLRDAKSANLKDKTNLMSLKLEWSGNDTETFASEVLEGLEPNSGLQKLSISYYMGGVISPSWLQKLVNLTSIELNYLPKCEQLPPLGKLPSLKSIMLWKMWSLKCFHDDDNATSRDEILFPSLLELFISDCSSLVSLPSDFPKLWSLKIEYCDKLRFLPDKIQSFRDLYEVTVIECEILRRRCERGIGEDWPKISHITHLDIETLRSEEEDSDEYEDKVDKAGFEHVHGVRRHRAFIFSKAPRL
ncbi:Disease resistance protein [Artemisia annua]|uniref:Disease resistance protein n=1 Tax=Artemisia annua TaxID=35608 RepID=A0A2U1P047_ARTAN|nr:Disease resistance protein [Artemisia annua]